MKSDVAVIGAGPAGIAAAIQLKRNKIDFLLFEKGRPGGLCKNAHRVENYPGFRNGIPGPQMVTLLQEHLDVYQITPHYETVMGLEYLKEEKIFLITTATAAYYAKVVVVASGTACRSVDSLDALPRSLRENIFYDILPVLKERGKRILITGADDEAFDYALNLGSYNNEVIIATPGEQLHVLPWLFDKVAANPRIVCNKNVEIKEIVEGKTKKLGVTFSTTDGATEDEVDYLIVVAGRTPQRVFYNPLLITQAKWLKAAGRLYEIGDLVNGIYRQAVIACGNGVQAAMQIAKDLQDPNFWV
ncbi:MAG TPA: NAD(P)/FAD-dependent oxidoreductase [Candidatus Deferrimicrobium sp.]|nr:NAD(P)/FAD-dependent oxidoreductase [Candidatus Deferrimicrobium sp.]